MSYSWMPTISRQLDWRLQRSPTVPCKVQSEKQLAAHCKTGCRNPGCHGEDVHRCGTSWKAKEFECEEEMFLRIRFLRPWGLPVFNRKETKAQREVEACPSHVIPRCMHAFNLAFSLLAGWNHHDRSHHGRVWVCF